MQEKSGIFYLLSTGVKKRDFLSFDHRYTKSVMAGQGAEQYILLVRNGSTQRINNTFEQRQKMIIQWIYGSWRDHYKKNESCR